MEKSVSEVKSIADPFDAPPGLSFTVKIPCTLASRPKVHAASGARVATRITQNVMFPELSVPMLKKSGQLFAGVAVTSPLVKL